MDQRLRTDEDAAAVFGAPILGRVPKVSDGERQEQIFLEAFQFLRTNMRLGGAARGNGDSRGLRVITVTSAHARGRQEHVVARLAEALGVVGFRVLAVDLDLRKPGLAAAFHQPPGGPGVAEVLTGEARLEEVIQATSHRSVRFVPAGSVQSSASSTINAAGVRVRNLVVDASRLADIVLLDTAPVSVGAETSAAAAVTDGALVVIDAENMRRDTLRAASEQLDRAGARVLGLVINRIQATLRRSAYGGYYDVPKGAGPRDSKPRAELPDRRRGSPAGVSLGDASAAASRRGRRQRTRAHHPRHHYRLAKALADAGFDVTTWRPRDLEPEGHVDAVPVRYLPTRKGRLARMTSAPLTMLAAARLRPDVVCAVSLDLLPWAVLLRTDRTLPRGL